MPPELVCIGNTYADGKDMRMHRLCRCLAYGYATPIRASLFSAEIRKKVVPDLPIVIGRSPARLHNM